MSRTNRKSKGKEINPTFFVFCEGETEEQYINFLRSKYRLPIVIDAKISGNRISEKYIQNYKKNKVVHPKDKNFLVYDLDVNVIVAKLKSLSNTVLLSSNPCFELWYLLHFQEQTAALNSVECNRKLILHNVNYKKGTHDRKFIDKLHDKQLKAIHRASKLIKHENPSTQVFLLINELEVIVKRKNDTIL